MGAVSRESRGYVGSFMELAKGPLMLASLSSLSGLFCMLCAVGLQDYWLRHSC